MSETHKDSRDSRPQTVIEVIKTPDGTFDLFINHELEREGIHEEGDGGPTLRPLWILL